MATTKSTLTNDLNMFISIISDNSGISDCIYTNTGNKKTKIGQYIYNNTYTVDGDKKKADVNAQLLNYNDAISRKGSVLGFNDSEYVFIYGHPDKWVYDYQQNYNNCGVDSSLNILSIAGVKDIVEITPSYAQYLATPETKTEKKYKYNKETHKWEYVTKEVTVLKKQPTETENEFLLWAIKNSKNDETWYLNQYNILKDDFLSGEYTPGETLDYFDESTIVGERESFVVHSKNYDDYKTIQDLKDHPEEIGGTTIWQRDNILDYWGVDSEMVTAKFKRIVDPGETIETPEDVVTVETPQYAGDETNNNVWYIKRTTVSISYGESFKSKTITTKVEEYYAKKVEDEQGNINYEKIEHSKPAITTTTKETTNLKNSELYAFAEDFAQKVKDGKGLIVQGDVSGFETGATGLHAISLVGVVYGDFITGSKEVTKDIEGQGSVTESDPAIKGKDILGFYVVDTGGFLNPGGVNESAQLITTETLYKFLTGNNYIKIKDIDEFDADTYYTDGKNNYYSWYNNTKENIRSWADDLNLVGNDRKNILVGNDSQNSIWAGKGNDVLKGEGGNDKLYGEAGNDTLYGGAGDDTLDGGSGNDTYVFEAHKEAQHDVINLGSGQDRIQFDNFDMDNYTYVDTQTKEALYSASSTIDKDNYSFANSNGNLVIHYKSQYQYRDYVDPTKDVTSEEWIDNTITVTNYFKKGLYNNLQYILTSTNFKDPSPDAYQLLKDLLNKSHIDYVVEENKDNKISGTMFADLITGGNKNDSISGGSANDTLSGGAGNDTIKAGSGKDIIYASYGNDKIYGESGTTSIIYDTQKYGYSGNDTIYSGKGNDIIDMRSFAKDDLTFVKAGNNLVITYDKTAGSSVTIADYFKKKGKVSVSDIKLSDTTYSVSNKKIYNEILEIINSESNKSVKADYSKAKEGQLITGSWGYETITGSKYDDIINGAGGNDVIYGGNGNDTIIGGLGDDKLYGQGGDNTYKFELLSNGNDTIYTSGNGKTILDFSSTDLEFTSSKITDGYDEYAYTKSGNDLIIKYAKTIDLYDISSLRISNFFKAKGDFLLVDKNHDLENALNVKDLTIYFNGSDTKKNKITGSQYNDYIQGYDYNDTLNGGNGDDTIIGGKGNDSITGGAGHNEIRYAQGDGTDTITLTKGENLDIKLSGYTDSSSLKFSISKNDLLISDGTETILKLKNFGTKDVTNNANSKKGIENTSSVKLFVGDDVIDLRNDKLFEDYTTFTTKKYKYTGNWHSEYIDASSLNEYVIKNDKGASINAGAGNDTIIGSIHNDTISGGDGDDVINGDLGVNKLDGGNGSDEYHIFSNTKGDNRLKETTTVNDTGKGATDIDTAILYDTKENIQIWFNIDKNGKYTDKKGITKFTVAELNDDGEKTGNEATISGVENIKVNGNTSDTSDDYSYNYNSNQLIESVVSWLGTNGYADVNDAMKNGTTPEREELLGYFNQADYWQSV